MCNEEAAAKDKNSDEDNLPGKRSLKFTVFLYFNCVCFFRPDYGIYRSRGPRDSVRVGGSRLYDGVPSGVLGPFPDI